MKKFAIGLVVAAVVTAVAGPLITGHMIENEWHNFVERINAETSNKVVLKSYEKSFLSAVAQLEVQLNTGVPEFDAKPILFPIDISHGPILFNTYSIGLASITINVPADHLGLETFTKYDDFASYSARLSFLNTVQHNIRVLPVENNVGNHVSFSGLEANFTSDMALKIFNGSVDVGRIAIQYTDSISGVMSKGSIEASTIQFDWREEFPRNGLMSGFSEWHMPAVSIKSGRVNVALQNMSVKATSDIKDELISLEQSLSIQSIKGPMNIDNLRYDFTMTNIQLATYEAFVAMSNTMQNIPKGSDNIDDSAMKELIRPLFQSGIRNDQRLSLEVAGGKIDAIFDAEYIGDHTVVDALFAQEDEKVLSSFVANLTASADAKAVMTTPLAFLLPGWSQQGFVQMKGDKLILEASIKDAMFNLNGQSVPLALLLAPKDEGQVAPAQ